MSTAQPLTPSSPAQAHASPIREETDDGVAYTVIPVTAQQEGVYRYPTTNGTAREYVDGEELTADSERWNGLPLTLRHPIVNVEGEPQYGLTTGPQANYTAVGEFRSAGRSSDTKLKGEVWIRTNEIGSHNGELDAYIQAIRAGRYGEVSTGYDSTPVADRGSHNGERYDARQTRINPDHVALLPDEPGNCSIASGCGVGRTNTQPAAAQADAEPRVNATMVSRTHALDSARTPTYSGTESQNWGDIPAGTLSHYTDNLSLDSDETGSWDDLTQSDRQTIAEHTLLGDPSADSTDEGIVFPVVNASTGSLNEGALDAVIGGRGSSANQPQSAIDSAQTRARSLLDDEFDRGVSTNVDADTEAGAGDTTASTVSDAHEESPVDPGGLRAAVRALADAVGLSVSPSDSTSDDTDTGTDAPADARTNQSAGDAVEWDSSNGSDDEPDSVRYGIVVDDLPDDEESVLVAVYEPTDDGWVATDETEAISPESLTVSGSDGVDSLPTVVDARSNAAVDASGDDADGNGEAEVEAEGDTESESSDSESEVDEAAESATGPQSDSSNDDESDTDIGPPASADSPNDSASDRDDGESASDSRSDADTESTAIADSDSTSDSEIMTDTDTNTDRTTTLVEEHGFKAENLPNEDEDCFGRIYEQFATTNDTDSSGSDGSADRQAAASASDDDDADDDAPNDDNGGNDDDSNSNGDDADRDTESGSPGAVDASDPSDDQQLVTASALEEMVDEKFEKLSAQVDDQVTEGVTNALESEKNSVERERTERAIANSAAPFSKESLGEMNEAAVETIYEEYVEGQPTTNASTTPYSSPAGQHGQGHQQDPNPNQGQGQQAPPSRSQSRSNYGGVRQPRSNADKSDSDSDDAPSAPVAGVRNRMNADADADSGED